MPRVFVNGGKEYKDGRVFRRYRYFIRELPFCVYQSGGGGNIYILV